MLRFKVDKPFFRIEYSALESEAWGNLNFPAKLLFFQINKLQRSYDKRGKTLNHSPDFIRISWSDVRGELSRASYYRAMDLLVRFGFIEVVDKGCFPAKRSIVRLSHNYLDRNLWDSPPF